MRLSSIGIAALLCAALACNEPSHDTKPPAPQPAATPPPAPNPALAANPAAKAPEPDYIKVQHCLIGFKGSLPKPSVTRSKDEAKTLAYQIFERAKKGEDFDAIVKQYTDDSPPGIYAMANIGKQPRNAQEYPRARMVAAFGDTGFPLKVGEYGIADFDPKKSPYGWHIVKRIE